MFLNEYIFSYNEVYNTLNKLIFSSKYNNIFRKKSPIGYTTFGYPIEYYTLGNGKKNILLIAATHGTEVITVTFILNFILCVVNNKEYYSLLEDYTFHIIPILNPEGYIISTSNVLRNIKGMNLYELECYSKKYLDLYNQDDYNAEHLEEKCDKLYKNLMTTSTEFILNHSLRNSVESILKSTDLDSKVLPIWSSNGMGVDPNANSIHQFENMLAFRKNQKYGKLRYNDIRVDIPSPHAYPGENVFDKNVPENIALYNLVKNLYDQNLLAFFSYHSTGGEIYGYPDENFTSKKQVEYNIKYMNEYAKCTGYSCIDEKYKYGVMDYYRTKLECTVTLTIELSKLNANPIGPFADIQNNVCREIDNNIKAIFHTLQCLNKTNP
ncbi:MAG: M14 family zinc carboxypeptidase [Clostridia bacterium]|nr:M14 family zinc carboxypeptidase [Clostridia bacterium]